MTAGFHALAPVKSVLDRRSRLCATLFISICLVYVACSTGLSGLCLAATAPADEGKALAGLGIEQYEKGDFTEAVKTLNKAIKLGTAGDEVRFYLAMAYLEKGMLKEGLSETKLISGGFSRRSELYLKLGDAYMNRGGLHDEAILSDAIHWYKEALAANGKDARPHFSLGLAYYEAGRFADAQREFEAVLELDPGYIGARENLALTYLAQGDRDRAFEEYGRALQGAPGDMGLRVAFGDLCLERGQYEEAIDQYSQVVNALPTYAVGHYKLATAYYRAGRVDEAIAEHKETTRLDPYFFYAYYGLGILYFERSMFNEAVEEFKRAIHYNPSYVSAYIGLGRAYMAMDRMVEAIAALKVATHLSVLDRDSHYWLGVAYARSNNEELAIRELRKTLHIDSTYTPARELLDQLRNP